ncbi:Uncharacterised protein [BD1-7 clade bacterium]|uniref:Bacteriophage Mu GpT domain-containing protein n=1 Tax=BD1-7 clade bacterium TaxID=2029982 RepID=A0A5S9P2T0_9GAMM|nr:Uncharacterised protein [BD1-7 clade bacterium]
MIITPAAIKSLFVGFKKNFQDGQQEAGPMYTHIATTVPSTTSANTYGWLGKVPSLREWVGDRVINDIKAHSYSITNKSWESTIGVDRDDIEDDEIGIYAPLFQEMGRAVEIHADELVYPLLNNGFTTLCYDGQPYFDDEHPVTAKADGTGTVAQVSNMLVDAGYTGPAWFLMDTTRAIKPIIFQQRKKPKFVQMVDEKDESVFMRKEFRFGVDCRDNVGVSFWQLAFGAKAELTYDNLWAAYTTMRGYTADGSRKLGVRPRTLVVPVALEKQARLLIERERLDNGESNELYKKFEIVVPDYL